MWTTFWAAFIPEDFEAIKVKAHTSEEDVANGVISAEDRGSISAEEEEEAEDDDKDGRPPPPPFFGKGGLPLL